MREPSETDRRVYLLPPRGDDADEFLSLARASRALHHPWVSPPGDEAAFTAYVGRNGGDDFRGFLACRHEDGAMVGVVNLSQVFRGSFNNAYLGFYGFAPFVRKGYMTEAVDLALRHAFRPMGCIELRRTCSRPTTGPGQWSNGWASDWRDSLRGISRSPGAGGITNAGRSSPTSGDRGTSRIGLPRVSEDQRVNGVVHGSGIP